MKNTDIFRELGGLDPDLVMNAAPAEESKVIKPKKSFAAYKKLIACAASFALIIGLFSVIGFDNVYASIQNIFSFIPGIGIEQTGDSIIYVYDPAGDRIIQEGKSAELLVASFKDGELMLIINSKGLPLMGKDVKLTRGGIELNQSNTLPAVSTDSGIISLTYETSAPEKSDLFLIEIAGFEQKLSFSMTPCEDYAALEQIGPTLEHNGISLTVTAKRVGNELVVWYYDTKSAEATADSIVGFGPIWGAPDRSNSKYIKTESGKIYPQAEGWNLYNRESFMLADGDKTATLHLPFIRMSRNEDTKLKIDVPAEKGIFECESFIETSLGKIKVTQIERKENDNNPEKDILMLKLEYEDAAPNTDIVSLMYKTDKDITAAISAGEEIGRTGYIEAVIPDDTDKVTFDISAIEYHLTDEYVFELDID